MSVDWMAMDEPLKPVPEFFVEAPDKKYGWTEIARQVHFLSMMRMAAPKVIVFAIPNAGKRNPAQARKEGIMAGIGDISAQWQGGEAWIEFKGYRARVAGKLSDAQIDWNNAMHRIGKNVACFYSPDKAIEWLRSLGAPIRRME